MELLEFVLKMVDTWQWCRIRRGVHKCGNGLGNQQNGTMKSHHGSDFSTMHIRGAKNAIRKFKSSSIIYLKSKNFIPSILLPYYFHIIITSFTLLMFTFYLISGNGKLFLKSTKTSYSYQINKLLLLIFNGSNSLQLSLFEKITFRYFSITF